VILIDGFRTRRVEGQAIRDAVLRDDAAKRIQNDVGHLICGRVAIHIIGRIQFRDSVNRAAALETLNSAPEVVAEGIQTILRREGVSGGYEKLKALTRGKKPSAQDIAAFIDGLDVSPKVKTELKSLSPENYTGLAAKIALLKIK